MREKFLPGMLCAIVFCCLAFPLISAEIPLVRFGKPAAEIVVSADAPEPEKTAANELSHWIEQITDVKIPVADAQGRGGTTRIYIGKKYAEGLWKEDLKKLEGNDGYSIRFRGNDIYLFGNHPRGSLYAVIALLESNSDIIWARPEPEFGTIFSKEKDFSVKSEDKLSVPAFSFRAWNVCSLRGHRPTGEWIMRNFGNFGDQTHAYNMGMLRVWGGGHGIYNILNPKDYFETRPDLFPYFPDSRQREPKSNFCLSNPDLPRIFTQELIKKVNAMEPKPDIIWIGVNDTWACCYCDNCLAPIPLPDGTFLEMKNPEAGKDPYFRSTQFFYYFMSPVAKEYSKVFPDIPLYTFAYIYTAEPPAVPVDPNLGILFAPYPTRNERYSLLDERQDKVWRERYIKWCEMTKNIGFYEYYSPNLRRTDLTAQIDLQSLKKHGGFGIMAENVPDVNKIGEGSPRPLSEPWDFNSFSEWIITHLYWDPDQDFDKLQKHYVERTYREAAAPMMRFFNLTKKSWQNPESKDFFNCHASDGNLFRSMIIQEGIETECRNALIEAEKLAKHPNSLKIIQAQRRMFEKYASGLNRIRVNRVQGKLNALPDFDAPVWKTAEPYANMIPSYAAVLKFMGLGEREYPKTEVFMLHDGDNMYMKMTAYDDRPEAWKNPPPDQNEPFPGAGDNFMIMLKYKNQKYYFAADFAGNAYDSKNADPDWESGWQIKTRKTANAWEFIASIPLSKLGYIEGDFKNPVFAFFRRECRHGDGGVPFELTSNGGNLNRNDYEMLFE